MAGPQLLSASSDDLGPVGAASGVLWGQACAEPVPLVDRLLARRDLGPLTAFAGYGLRDLSGAIPGDASIFSYGALGQLRRLPGLSVIPCSYSALPRLIADGSIRADLLLLQLSPPGRDGYCSFGAGAEYLCDAVPHAGLIVAEINERCPVTSGARIAWDRLDAVLHTSRPLLEDRPRPVGEQERVIGQHVAELIEDGDTIQLGVGALPEAIMGALTDHGDLGLHSGIITDGTMALIEAGVITNARKSGDDAGVTITGCAIGTEPLFTSLDGRADIRFEPTSLTHHPGRLAALPRLSAINSAVEIDLLGQINGESAGGRYVGAIGGQADFFRAASASGGKAIVALPAERILATLSGPVSTARSDVEWVVTEHGSRCLSGLTDAGRRRAMLDLAGPRRDELERSLSAA